MKQFISFLFFISLFTNYVKAQNIEYAYDASGNRILRHVVVLDKTPEQDTVITELANKSISDNTSSSTQNSPDLISDQTQTIVYPNPAEGIVYVKLNKSLNTQSTNIRLFSLSGTLIMTRKAESSDTEIDFTNLAAGNYILKITDKSNFEEFKIIKK